MNNPTNSEEENIFSFKETVLSIKTWIDYLISHKKQILIGTSIIFLLFVGYRYFKKPIYTATTTFFLNSGSKSSDVLNLASTIGVQMGQSKFTDNIFDTENIVVLYRSYQLLKKTFLQNVEINGENKRLITRYAEKNKLLEDWQDDFEGFTFEIPENSMTVLHDSILMEVIDKFKEKEFGVSKLDRNLNALIVEVSSKDQLFALHFNKILVENVNNFYLETKTKKSEYNLQVLQYQSDSVRSLISRLIKEMKDLSVLNPNPNPLYNNNFEKIKNLEIDLTTSQVAYQEIITNLEISKISHLNSTPIIQIVDSPILPLEDDKYSILKLLVFGFIVGVVSMVAFYSAKMLFIYGMKN